MGSSESSQEKEHQESSQHPLLLRLAEKQAVKLTQTLVRSEGMAVHHLLGK